MANGGRALVGKLLGRVRPGDAEDAAADGDVPAVIR
jgi:hypothetical protein